MSISDLPASRPRRLEVLQRRIGWLCQAARLLAAAYAVWTLWLVVSHWLMSNGTYEFTGSPEQFGGLGINLAIWVLVAVACYQAWLLFSAYLKGEVFTVGSALLLRRTALLGLAAIVADIILRPIVGLLRFGSLPAVTGSGYFYFSPHDLVLLLFLVSLFAIAHIFKVAAELADENNAIL